MYCKENYGDQSLLNIEHKDFDKIFKYKNMVEYCKLNKQFMNNITGYNVLVNGAIPIQLDNVCKLDNNILEIKNTIFNKGPVIALVKFFADFFYYSEGIYSKETNNVMKNYYPIIIIGWGVDQNNNEEYWLVKVDWGKGWGEKGLAKISMKEVNSHLKLLDNVYFTNITEMEVGKE